VRAHGGIREVFEGRAFERRQRWRAERELRAKLADEVRRFGRLQYRPANGRVQTVGGVDVTEPMKRMLLDLELRRLALFASAEHAGNDRLRIAASSLNWALAANRKKALRRHEPSYAATVQRVLEQAGHDAASRFRAKATRRLIAAGNPPAWTLPHRDEVFDAEAFVNTLRTKTDPIRRKVIEELGEGIPIAWDVTNPLAGKALARSARNVTRIGEATRSTLMRTIRAAYEEGLSVDDTAKAIRGAMRDAAPSRARRIAATELAAVANGGAVALVQTVAAETGTTYKKRWLTAPGAAHPRHEEHVGLDGQTVPLDGVFAVGRAQLEYPGDPAGPVDEVAQCRCTVVFVEAA